MENSYAFLAQEWFWSALSFNLALISSIVAIVMWRKDSANKLREEKKSVLAQIVRNDLELKKTYRDCWSKIASFPGDAKTEIFAKQINHIKNDEIRVSIFQIIDILSDVYFFYSTFEQDIHVSQWKQNFSHTFNPNKMVCFVSAFDKYRENQKFSLEFENFVKEIIIENNKQFKKNPIKKLKN